MTQLLSCLTLTYSNDLTMLEVQNA